MTHPRRGRLHTQTASIRITAAPERVWELITTVDAVCLWYDTWDTVQNDTTDPRLRVGSSFHLTRRRRGRAVTARCQVTDLTAPSRLCWEQSAPHTPTTTVEFLLIPGTETGTTELRHTRTWASP
ncbi:MAG: SRPBCC domain-containing protein [Mycobacterium sp.]